MFAGRDGALVALVPKVATRSIVTALAPHPLFRTVTNDEAQLDLVRVMFVRDPIERFTSAYSFLTSVKLHPPAEWAGYHGFVDWALASPDLHVASQYSQVLAGDTFVPNVLHSLKEVASVWGKYYPGVIPDDEPFPHRNRCQALGIDDYRRDEIEAKYAKDFELCRQV